MVLRSPVESGAEDVGSTGERKNLLEPFQALAVDDSNDLEIEGFKREPILASVGCDRRNCITLAIPDFVNSKSSNLIPERRQQWSLDFQGALESTRFRQMALRAPPLGRARFSCPLARALSMDWELTGSI